MTVSLSLLSRSFNPDLDLDLASFSVSASVTLSFPRWKVAGAVARSFPRWITRTVIRTARAVPLRPSLSLSRFRSLCFWIDFRSRSI